MDNNEINTESEVKYVGFWARFAAFLIDSIAASLLMSPFVRGASQLDIGRLSDPNFAPLYLREMTMQMSIEMLIVGAIFIAFWIKFAATPGKLLFKSYIVNAADYSVATKKQMLIRYLGYFVSLFAFGLGFIWIGLDKRKQAWHDKIAGTVVINLPPK